MPTPTEYDQQQDIRINETKDVFDATIVGVQQRITGIENRVIALETKFKKCGILRLLCGG